MKNKFQPVQWIKNYCQCFCSTAVFSLLIVAALTVKNVLQLPHGYSSAEYDAINRTFAWILPALGCGALFSAAGTCLAEKYAWPKWLPWPAAAVGVGLSYVFPFGGLILMSIFLFLHGALPKEKPGIRLGQVAAWLILSLAVSTVLFISFMMCYAAVSLLLLSGADYRVLSLIMGLCAQISYLLFAPCLFLGGLPRSETPDKAHAWFSKICSLLLLPAFLFLIGILFVYIIKTVFTFTMPVGEMNPFGLLSLTAFILLYLVLTGEENKLTGWFKKWGGLLMLPIFIIQAIGVCIRINAYGFTTARILGIVWTLLCMAVVVCSLLRKRSYWFFMAAAVAAFVFLCSPLRAEKLAIWNQESRLQAALERNQMINPQGEIVPNPNADVQDREIIYSAAEYLMDAPEQSKGLCGQLQSQLKAIREKTLINDVPRTWISSQDWEELLGFKKATFWYYKEYIFQGTANVKTLDTRNWDYAAWVSIRQREATQESDDFITGDMETLFRQGYEHVLNETPFVVTEELLVTVDGETADLTPLMQGLSCDVGQVQKLPNDQLVFPSGKTLHISELRFEIYNREESVTKGGIVLNGWLLTPEAE